MTEAERQRVQAAMRLLCLGYTRGDAAKTQALMDLWAMEHTGASLTEISAQTGVPKNWLWRHQEPFRALVRLALTFMQPEA